MMERSTIFAGVTRCPACGYCAADVSKPNPEARAVIESQAYKDQLNKTAYPDLANSFLCMAMIEGAANNLADATWSLISAAWACDDAERDEQAAVCRKQAAEMFLKAKAGGQPAVQEDGTDMIILVDLLRRSGQMEKARDTIAAIRGGITEDILLSILDFQKTLIDQNDMACHTVGEVKGEQE
jgi:hypothetical protein